MYAYMYIYQDFYPAFHCKWAPSLRAGHNRLLKTYNNISHTIHVKNLIPYQQMTANRNLIRSAGWLKKSQLTLNSLKTEVLYMNRACPRLVIQLPTSKGVPLVPLSEIRSLGMVLNAPLSMQAQITMASRLPFIVGG